MARWVVNVSLALFQCSRARTREAERLLTVMKSRPLEVHRRRMHFRRSSRLSALADKIRQKKRHNGGWESGVLEFNSVRNYIRPDIVAALVCPRKLS